VTAGAADPLGAWLAQAAPEPILEPDLPIVDPHHHLWDRGGHRYLAEELRADLDGGHAIVATGYVECLSAYRGEGPAELRPVGETVFAATALRAPLAARRGAIRAGAAIVGFADLALGAAVEPVLAAHRDAAPDRFRGIRYVAAWHPGDAIHGAYPTDAGMLARPEVRAGITAVGAMGLVFDSWTYFTQLDEVGAAADACPDTLFVLDHLGGPIGIGPYAGRRDDVFAAWRDGLAALARRPNIVVKLGGLGMALAGFGFRKLAVPPSSAVLAEAWAPYLETAIQLFGVERAMFESNYPVDRTSGTHATIWNAFKRVAAGATASEKAALFAGTAARVYGIAL
jgi:predicted TIM-barrel fold metal-dependent hydrolase